MAVPPSTPMSGLTLESLVAHRELYRSLAANLPRGSLHVFDRDLRFLFAGGPALAEHGFDAAAVEGKTLAETVPAELVDLLTAHYRRALDGNNVEFDFSTSKGKVFHTRIRPVRGVDGAVIAGLLVSEDVSEARRLTAQLEETATQLRSAQRLAGLGTFRYELASGVYEVNDELRAMWGLPPGAVDPTALRQQVHPDDLPVTHDAWQEAISGPGRMSYEHRIVRARDGEVRHLRVELEGELAADGSLFAVRGTQLDVTDLVQARIDVAQAQQLTSAVLAASPDLTVLLDVRRLHVLWSSGDLGSESALSVGEDRPWNLLEQVHPDDVVTAYAALESIQRAEHGDTLSVRLRIRQDPAVGDQWRWLSVWVTPFRHDARGVVEVVVAARDVHDVVEAEALMQHAAHHDALTGLPNRTLLMSTLEAQLAGVPSWEGALLYVDLDHFKRVNDQFGHTVGDRVLVAVAQRLSSVIRPPDLCARVGGDEFVVLLAASARGDAGDGRPVSERAVLLAERLRSVAAEPVEYAGHSHVLSASVGIRLATPGLTAQDALRDADSAMYVAKEQGRDRGVLFESSQRYESEHQAQTEQLLRLTLADDTSLGLAYQPIFDVASGRMLAVEALARMSLPDGTPVDPGHFIAVAEQSGLIGRLGVVVLDRACRELRSWRAVTPAASALQLAVNLSARQAQDPGLADKVLRTVVRNGLAPNDLVLELTETVLLNAGLPALNELRRLRHAGIGIAIDDFGVGYASLRYLATLPVTSLKVDRSFTAGLPDDVVSCTIVRAVAGLAADMGLTCVVEGIETQAQLEALPEGVQGQGFHLGRPVAAEHFLALLQASGAVDVPS